MSATALRVIALGEFSASLPPLAARLESLKVEPQRCADPAQLPPALAASDILLAELGWLNRLAPAQREALARQAAGAAGWVALSDGSTGFKDQVGWLRAGVRNFFPLPLDAERLATLVEDIHDRLHGPPPRVLLLDDDASALAFHTEILRRAGLAVEATQDPLIALDVIDAFRPDVLLVDIEMPGCRGPELVAMVRQHADHEQLPVVFLTAMAGMQDKLLARQAAAEDYLAKPVAPELLVASVLSHARRHRAQQRAAASRVRLETKARWRLEQFRQAVDAHAIVSVTDTRGNILYVNDRFCAVSGYTRDELLGQNHRIVKSGVHPPELYRSMWQTIAGGRIWHGEICNRRRDGTLYWVEATIVPFLDGRGKPVEYISIRTDVTALKRSQEEAARSEERLRRSQMFANIGTWDWNIATGELYWSERIAPLFGYADGALETSYDNFLAAVHPDDRRRVIDAIEASVDRGAPYEVEHRVVWPDGTVRWLLERGNVVRSEEGTPLQMLGTVQDITARIAAERRLRESEQRFSFAVEGAGDGVWDWDMRSGRMLFSGHYEAMLGYQRGEVEPTIDAWQRSVHPDDLGRAGSNLDDYLAGRLLVYAIELRLRRKDGSYAWILCRGTVVERDAAGEPTRMIGIHSDISERKAAEERIALFRRIFEASQQSIGVADAEGRLIYINTSHEKLLGYSQEEVAGQPFAVFLPAEEAPAVAAEIREAVAAGRSWTGLLTLRRKDGSRFVSASNVSFVTGADGRLQNIFNVFTDFSEELARRDELAQAKEVAERASQAKSDFLSSMSHELRTPMNAIIGFAQMLEYDEALNADQLDNVSEILKAGRHLLDLINEVLDLAKIEAGRVDLSLEPVELPALVEDCVQMIQPLAAAKAIAIGISVPTGAAVRADRVRLKQVLVNLLSNAVKYNREGGRVDIRIAPAGERMRIEVADTGAGIADDRLAELFQPFHRLDAEGSEIEGTGIGLTITQRLVELMGGSVGVDSRLGVGTTFWIELPGETMASSVETGGRAPERIVAAQRMLDVLCIDDNPVNLKLLAQMLGRRPHLRISTAHTPELGIELALAHRPSLILLDINMPGMNGYQVLDILKADSRLRGTPVVAVTANAMPRDVKRGLEAGFAAYLTKPLDLAQFLHTIDDCLAGKGGMET